MVKRSPLIGTSTVEDYNFLYSPQIQTFMLKFRHKSIETVNTVIEKELKISKPSNDWKCGSTINVMVNPFEDKS